jgi:hypothetical protein
VKSNAHENHQINHENYKMNNSNVSPKKEPKEEKKQTQRSKEKSEIHYKGPEHYDNNEAIEESKANNMEPIDNNPRRRQLSIKQIDEMVTERRKELEHVLYDDITKLELTERKILEEIKENENEEDKAMLEKNYGNVKSENEKIIEKKKL